MSYASLYGDWAGADLGWVDMPWALLDAVFVTSGTTTTTANGADLAYADLRGARIEYSAQMCFVQFQSVIMDSETCLAGDFRAAQNLERAFDDSFTGWVGSEDVDVVPAWGQDIECPDGSNTGSVGRPGCHRSRSTLANRTSINLSCGCLLYTSPSPRDLSTSRMPSSA